MSKAVIVESSQLFHPPVGSCGTCRDTGPISVRCEKCGKTACVECALDIEIETNWCWMCLDWTAEGKAIKREHGFRR